MYNLKNIKTHQKGVALLELLIIISISIVIISSISGLIWHYGDQLTRNQNIVSSKNILIKAGINNYYQNIYNYYENHEKEPSNRRPNCFNKTGEECYQINCNYNNTLLANENAGHVLGYYQVKTPRKNSGNKPPDDYGTYFFNLNNIALGVSASDYNTKEYHDKEFGYTIQYNCQNNPEASFDLSITLPKGMKINSNLVHADKINYLEESKRYEIIWQKIPITRDQFNSWGNKQISTINMLNYHQTAG